MRSLRVVDAGLFTTVQDLGRPGHGMIGVPPSGAADTLSHTIGNRLLGNADGAAALECTLIGPSVTLEHDAWICLTGAGCPKACILSAEIERPLPWCEPTHVHAGDLIKIGGTGDSARAYLCVSGGFGVPPVLGSRSTLVSAAIGGHKGRAIRHRDVLAVIDTKSQPRSLPSGLHTWLRSRLTRRVARLVPSLHTDRFPPDAVEQLAAVRFSVSEQSDRIGVRLDGPMISLPADAGLFESEPTVTGGIQISGNARPIVLGVDRPATGGYPLLACVIGVDLPAVAMLRPGDTLRFEMISREAARRLAAEERRVLDTFLPPCEDGVGV